jgi:predicted amidohydrolase YtcJ
MDLINAVVPARDEAVRIAALGTAADYYLARGVTWVQDAWVDPPDVDTYIEAAARDALRIRFNLAFYADPRHFDSQVDQFADARRRVDDAGSPLLTAQTVKFFADGVIENETGALLAPYCSGLHDHGMQTWEGDSLAEAARRVDELGLQIHIHAIGDAAVRQALDALEEVARRNGPRDRRPVIAHAQLVDDADINRFAELGVIPNMQPLWAQLDALMTVLTIPRLGTDRADKQYRIQTIDKSGAPLAFGSDWPVSSGAPLDGIAVAVSRQTTDGNPDGGWIPDEILPIERALSAYTAGVARQAFAEDRWGRIMPGASADLVCLNRDPRTTPALDLPALRVLGTYLDGQPVYSATD